MCGFDNDNMPALLAFFVMLNCSHRWRIMFGGLRRCERLLQDSCQRQEFVPPEHSGSAVYCTFETWVTCAERTCKELAAVLGIRCLGGVYRCYVCVRFVHLILTVMYMYFVARERNLALVDYITNLVLMYNMSMY